MNEPRLYRLLLPTAFCVGAVLMQPSCSSPGKHACPQNCSPTSSPSKTGSGEGLAPPQKELNEATANWLWHVLESLDPRLKELDKKLDETLTEAIVTGSDEAVHRLGGRSIATVITYPSGTMMLIRYPSGRRWMIAGGQTTSMPSSQCTYPVTSGPVRTSPAEGNPPSGQPSSQSVLTR